MVLFTLISEVICCSFPEVQSHLGLKVDLKHNLPNKFDKQNWLLEAYRQKYQFEINLGYWPP